MYKDCLKNMTQSFFYPVTLGSAYNLGKFFLNHTRHLSF